MSTLAIAGLIRFPSENMPKLLASLQPLLDAMSECRGFFCVSGQSAEEPVIRQWASDHGISVDFIVDLLELPANRYARMATVRNRYLNAVHQSGFDPDYLLAMDMDFAGFADWSGLTDLLADKAWTVAATLGLWPKGHEVSYSPPDNAVLFRGEHYVYYDMLALETTDSRRVLWSNVSPHSPGWYWHGDAPWETIYSRSFPIDFAQAPELVPVNSAFGPAAFYRWQSIKLLRHDETDNPNREVCHQPYHRNIRENGGTIVICQRIVSLYKDPHGELWPNFGHIPS